ncbi:MAG: metalloregulator ArsR/SmtB family transcription factor [Methanomassiliicoccales archaeon]
MGESKDESVGKDKLEGLAELPEEVENGLRSVGGLEGLKACIPDEDEMRAISELHNALSDPIRIRIIHSLAACDLCPCVLKALTGLSDSRLSYHLNVLEEAGLVISQSKRRWRIYALTDKARKCISIEESKENEKSQG